MAKSISRYLADISSTSGVLDGTLSTAAQTNITSLGTLSSLTVSGAMNGTLSTAAQPNITSVGTLTTLAMGGSITRTGDLTLDVSGDIIFDADNGDFYFKDGGTTKGFISTGNNNFGITSSVSDDDIVFTGSDGGSAITALRLDMSDAGTAIFNHDVILSDNGKIGLGTGADTQMYYDGSRLNINNTGDVVFDTSGSIYLDADGGKVYLQDAGTEKIRFVMDNAGYVQIYSAVSNDDIKIQGNDGGSVVDALVFDMSEAGAATFNSTVTIPKLLTLNNPASVQAKFNPNNDSFAALAEFYNGTSTSNPFVVGQGYASGTDNIAYVWNRANQPLLLGTNNTERMRIDSSGNVSIGNSSVAFPSGEGLQVYSSGNPRIKLANSSTGVASGDGTQFYLDGVDVIYDNKDAGNQRWYTGGAERMRITNAGYVTKSELPSFHARLSNTTGVNAASGVHVNYGNNSVSHNNGSHFKTSGSDAYMFVAPVAGKYYFQASLRVDAFSGNYTYLTLFKINTARSASTIYSRDLSAAQLAYQNHNVQAVVDMSANEAVWVQYQNNGDSSVNFDSDSWFSGYLIG